MKNSLHEIEYYGKKVNFYLPNEMDHIQSIIKKTNTFYEIEMLKDILKIVNPNGVVVDAGANIGNHTLFFSMICGMKTHSFEPSDKISEIFIENIKINNLEERVEFYKFALGSKEKNANLVFPSNENLGMARIAESSSAGEKIQVKTLDSFNFEDVNLLKIDVEGMELEVLRGSLNTIRKNHPIILAELQKVDEYNSVKSFLYNEDYVVSERYNATPTMMFWHKEKILEYLPFFLSRGSL